ncbi:MAG: tripartite tricarboxylate transporter TctB family protein [Usitatibacteraceae bacterium]
MADRGTTPVRAGGPAADDQAPPRRHTGQVLLAAGVVVFGVAVAFGTAQLPEATGYAKVGPRLMPTIVSAGLVLLGLLLLKEALWGGFRGVDEVEESLQPTDWRAFAWITAGIILDGIMIVPIGFVISGTMLFMLAARGFGSTKWVKNGVIGLIIATATYAFFNYGLGLGLPRGILPV